MPSRQFVYSWDPQLSVVLISCNIKVLVSQRTKGEASSERCTVLVTLAIRSLEI